MKNRRCLLGLALSVVFGGCGSSSGPAPAEQVVTTTVGEIHDLMLASSGPDTDGDGIPDDVERSALLGTDPNERDTDADGVEDIFEVFGRSFLFVLTGGAAGELHRDDTLFDSNRNDVQAATDPEESSVEHMIDSDGDGVYDYLEYFGYRYDWGAGRFVMWTEADREAHPGIAWFRTDPLQPSTDQDAYPDGMEVSGLLMDVAVRDPGRHPLVPALPNIVVRIEGYEVTLNDDVTYEDGGSVAKGYSWTRETELAASQSDNLGVEVGIEAGYDGGVVAKGHVNASYGHQWSHTTTVSNAAATTVNSEINWNRARSHNPTQAAQLKLLLKIENHGTCPVSNLVPTLNLSIGGANVATFKPSSLEVNMLMPGAAYPEGEATYWVVDASENGPLMLTDWELRALESGAPVQIFVTQVDADVMRLSEEGEWASAGDVNEYMARCEAVGATVFVDFGGGDFVYSHVYGGEGPTAPPVTLGDALRWTMNLAEEDGHRYLEKPMADGGAKRIEMTNAGGEGHAIHVGSRSFGRLAGLEDPLDLPLTPGDHVEVVPPRDPGESVPRIYSAYAVPHDGGYLVTACATDFDGVAKVEYVDGDDVAYPMTPDGRGPWFYSCSIPAGSLAGNALERIEVRSVNDAVAVASVEVEIIHTVVSLPPFIGSMVYDVSSNVLQVTIKPGTDLPQDAIDETDWPRLYHPSIGGDFVVMKRTNFWFERPYVYEVEVPVDEEDWDGNGSPLRVVAKSSGGDYTAVEVRDVETVDPHGWGRIYVECLFFAPSLFDSSDHWQVVPIVEFDQWTGERHPTVDFTVGWSPWTGHLSFTWPTPEDGALYVQTDGPWPAEETSPFPSGTQYDLYLRSAQDRNHMSVHRLGFLSQWGGRKLDPTASGKAPLVFYQELTLDDMRDWEDTFEPGSGAQSHPYPGDVYGFRTTGGRYGKLYIKKTSLTFFRNVLQIPYGTLFAVEAEFVIFRDS